MAVYAPLLQPEVTVLRNNKGVTLVEVMLALVITVIVFIGLIQASIVAIGANMRNELRDEAVRLSSDLMSELRAAPFGDIDRDGTADTEPRNFNRNQTLTIRNAAVPYTVAVNVCSTTCVPALDANHKQMTVTTTWIWQGETITHTIMAYRGQ
jgi:Tfp pilus assembly protein PilV